MTISSVCKNEMYNDALFLVAVISAMLFSDEMSCESIKLNYSCGFQRHYLVYWCLPA